MRQFCLSLLQIWLIFFIGGCGGSTQDFVVVGQGSGGSGPTTATVRLQSILAQSVVPDSVDSFRSTGFDGNLNHIFGPVTRDKAAVVEWTGVPIEVTDFVIEYLAGGKIVGIAQAEVRLTAGETFLIENPTILEVTAPLESLAMSPTSSTIANGTSTSFTTTGRFTDGTSLDLTSVVSWRSTNPQIATLEQGVAQGLSPGSTTVRATFGGRGAEASLTVSEAKVVSLAISPESPAMAQGTSIPLAVVGFFSDGTLQTLTNDAVWTSSETSVATVDGGLARGHSPGQAIITASFGETSTSTMVTVTDASLKHLEIRGGRSRIAKGTETEFQAIGTFADETTQDLTSQASWSSSSPTVASVLNGRARGLQEGSTNLSASLGELSDSVALEVTAAEVTGVTVQTLVPNGPTLLGVDQSLGLSATAIYSDGSSQHVTANANWSSDDSNVATVSLGVVTGVSPGQADISATFGGQSGELRVTVQDQKVPRPDLALDQAGAYHFDTQTGVLTPPSGSPGVPLGWDAGHHRLELGAFRIEAGANLNVTGTVAFRVHAEETLSIAGTLSRNGADGPPGQMGEDGGQVELFSANDLNVTGSIEARGGNGGHATSLGQSGAAGGNGGAVTLIAGGSITASIDTRGGSGGSGSSGLTGSPGATPGASGQTGAIGGAGGPGGQGGAVILVTQGSLSSNVQAEGGGGGNGGQGGEGGQGAKGLPGSNGAHGANGVLPGAHGGPGQIGGVGSSGGTGGNGGGGGPGGVGGLGGLVTTSGAQAPLETNQAASGLTGIAGLEGNGGRGGEGGDGGNGGDGGAGAAGASGVIGQDGGHGGVGGNGGVGGVGGVGGLGSILGSNGVFGVAGDGGRGGDGGHGGDGASGPGSPGSPGQPNIGASGGGGGTGGLGGPG